MMLTGNAAVTACSFSAALCAAGFEYVRFMSLASVNDVNDNAGGGNRGYRLQLGRRKNKRRLDVNALHVQHLTSQ